MLKRNGINLLRKAKEKKSWDLENHDLLRTSLSLQIKVLRKVGLLFFLRELWREYTDDRNANRWYSTFLLHTPLWTWVFYQMLGNKIKKWNKNILPAFQNCFFTPVHTISHHPGSNQRCYRPCWTPWPRPKAFSIKIYAWRCSYSWENENYHFYQENRSNSWWGKI